MVPRGAPRAGRRAARRRAPRGGPSRCAHRQPLRLRRQPRGLSGHARRRQLLVHDLPRLRRAHALHLLRHARRRWRAVPRGLQRRAGRAQRRSIPAQRPHWPRRGQRSPGRPLPPGGARRGGPCGRSRPGGGSGGSGGGGSGGSGGSGGRLRAAVRAAPRPRRRLLGVRCRLAGAQRALLPGPQRRRRRAAPRELANSGGRRGACGQARRRRESHACA